MNQGHIVVQNDRILADVPNDNAEQVSELIHKEALDNTISVCTLG